MFVMRDRTVRFGLVSKVPMSQAQTTVQSQATSEITRVFGNVARKYGVDGLLHVMGNDTDPAWITLTQVSSIKVSFESDVAIENGVSSSIIQPWYIKPAEIAIEGASYIGAIPFKQRTDNDLEKLYAKYRESQNEYGTIASAGNRKLFKLEIVNNPRDADVFFGYIRRMDISENIDKPYLLTYSISFVGKPTMNFVNLTASTLARQDYLLKK